jgi:hypothetical protein
MELVAIVLSIPVAFVACLVYCFLIAKYVVHTETLRRAMCAVSAVVLAAIAIEITLLATLGAVASRAAIGPAFYVAHVIGFFLGTPALANMLVLGKHGKILRWYWAIPICTLFAFGSVLLQYGVSEALYGVDDMDGPFSMARASEEFVLRYAWSAEPDRHSAV